MAANETTPIRPDYDAQAIELVGHARELNPAAAVEIIAGRLRDAFRAGQVAAIAERVGTVSLHRQLVVIVEDEALPWSRGIAAPLVERIMQAVG